MLCHVIFHDVDQLRSRIRTFSLPPDVPRWCNSVLYSDSIYLRVGQGSLACIEKFKEFLQNRQTDYTSLSFVH